MRRDPRFGDSGDNPDVIDRRGAPQPRGDDEPGTRGEAPALVRLSDARRSVRIAAVACGGLAFLVGLLAGSLSHRGRPGGGPRRSRR